MRETIIPDEGYVRELLPWTLRGKVANGADIREVLKCDECDEVMKLEVLQSAAGFYVGTRCINCGPYYRESDYFSNVAKARMALRWWAERGWPVYLD